MNTSTEHEPEEWPAKAHPEMMTVADLATVSQLSESYWYQAIAEGRCQHYRFGKGQGGIRVSVEQYEVFLKAIERGGEPVKAETPTPRPEKFHHLPPRS